MKKEVKPEMMFFRASTAMRNWIIEQSNADGRSMSNWITRKLEELMRRESEDRPTVS